MTNNYTFRNTLGSAMLGIALFGFSFGAQAQCTTWVSPTDSSGWSDFNTAFGGAPCDDGSGCPFNEITAFEVWADEAYAMTGINAGGVYTFSACNSVGGTAWNMMFTIVAPSGAVDAFGLDAGSVCALTFTASESGVYLIVVSEVGACGTSTNFDTNNGFPAITCQSSAATACVVGVGEVATPWGLEVGPNPSTGLFTLTAGTDLRGMEVFDVNGRLLEGLNIVRTGLGVYTLDLSSYEAGTYMLRTTLNGERITKRLVVTR